MRLAADAKQPKAERLYTGMDRLYSGVAMFPREAPWLEVLRREMMSFPNGRHDDQVDSISQFLTYAVSNVQRRLNERR
jgi:predicted phage terminase large subunit-like protein